MRPGLWMRPLCAPDNASEEILLSPNAHANNPQNYRYLDPTIRRNRDYIKECFAAYSAWGIEMLKHDYSSYDIFGKWGFEMFAAADMTRGDWSFYDKTKTNAEVVLDLYRLIRRECGDMYVIGCNTFSHLSAGLFELQRTGDDTSGLEWARTLKMGVNTLAFRAPQHNAFYSCDADCVGLRVDIKWELNRQWMELLAESGTPLFISPQPKAVGAEQRECIKKCFELASKTLPTVGARLVRDAHAAKMEAQRQNTNIQLESVVSMKFFLFISAFALVSVAFGGETAEITTTFFDGYDGVEGNMARLRRKRESDPRNRKVGNREKCQIH